MILKKGMNVKIISGSLKGTLTKVISIKNNSVIVEYTKKNSQQKEKYIKISLSNLSLL